MSRSRLIAISVACQVFLAIRAALVLPTLLSFDSTGGVANVAAEAGRHAGHILAVIIWLVLPAVQWMKKGGWSLGIAIFAAFTLLAQAGLLTLAISAGRVHSVPSAIANFVLLSVSVLGLLTFVNVRLYMKKEPKEAEPGATDNPDDAQRLREDY